MRPSQTRQTRRFRDIAPMLTGLLCAVLAGCVSNPNRATVEKNIMSDRGSDAQRQSLDEKYRVGCPDVLQIRAEDRREFDGQYVVGPNGRVKLGRYGEIRAEGRTLPEIARVVAETIGSSPEKVRVRVVEFCSRHLVLIGEVVGRHRTIPYQGRETVLEVLQRSGGITQGAEPTEVYVLRSHIGDLQRPEVFHVDLQSIVLNKNHASNIQVLPYDQIHVGETRQARVEKCIPPWLRPIYETFHHTTPNGKTAQEKERSFTQWFTGWFGE